MKRLATFLVVCLSALTFAAAQATMPKIQYNQNSDETYEAETDGEINSDEDDDYEEGDISFDYGMHLPGDQYIRLALGVTFPLNFPTLHSAFVGKSQLKIGGAGTIGYHSYVTSKIAIGVDVGFGFNLSIGKHSFNTVPVVITATYEPALWKFSFPLTLGVGFAWESFNGKNYFPGLVVKPEIGCQYRINDSWTIGVESAYMFLPEFNQLHGNGPNKYGHFWTADICARYMF